MFRHKAHERTLFHNIALASVLSFTAGIVNVVGVFHLGVLTTNITGHFAFFSEELAQGKYVTAFIFFLYIIFFFLGAFVSSFLVELLSKSKPEVAHTPPLLIELFIFLTIGFSEFYTSFFLLNENSIAFLLLFAMGLQNSLVSKISHSVVRTTHLTGLFTDLGIELSQLFFYRTQDQTTTLKQNIFLKLIIVFTFFLGCILGGWLYQFYGISSIMLASLCIILVLMYDNTKYVVSRFYKNKNSID